MIGPVFWLTGDATLTRVSGINWSARTFVATTVGCLLLPFTQPHVHSHVIADVELRPIALKVVCLVEFVAPGAISLLVSDNANALSWIATGKARHGSGLQLLRAILAYLEKNKMRLRGMYVRTFQNVTSDMMRREKLAEIKERDANEKFIWMEPDHDWANFLSTLHMGDDWYVTDLTPDGPVGTWVPYGLVVEWHPSYYTLRREALKFGLTPAYLQPRNPAAERLMRGIEELAASPDQITLLGGAVISEFEILDFQEEVGRLGRMGTVLIVPIGVADPSDRRWGRYREMPPGGMDMGDVLCGEWQVWRKGYPAYETITPKSKGRRALSTIGIRAGECGCDLASENKGELRPREMGPFEGRMVTIGDQMWGKRH